MAEASRGRAIAIWVVSGLLTLLYVAAGGPKIVGAEEPAKNFVAWGYGDSFRILIGIVEVVGGIGLLVPRVASLAAAGLFVVMLGAVYTHITHGVPGVFIPATCLVLLGLVGYARRADLDARLRAALGGAAPAAR